MVLSSFLPLLVLFIFCLFVFPFVCSLLYHFLVVFCVLQNEEAMLSAMVEVADSLVTDMFQAKACYRKIFSV